MKNKIVFTSLEAMVEFSREKNKTSIDARQNPYFLLKGQFVIVIVIARIGHSPWGFSGPILQCFLRLLGEIGRQLI